MIFSSDMSASCSSVSADAARQGEGLCEGARGKEEMMGITEKGINREMEQKETCREEFVSSACTSGRMSTSNGSSETPTPST